MKRIATLLALCLFPALANGQTSPNINVRGTIVSASENALVVRTSDGHSSTLEIPPQVNVATTKPFSISDIKPGMKLGVTTIVRADGQIVAIDVRPISPAANVGLSPYDLQAGSTMTNGVLEAIVDASRGRELVLNYQTGQVKILVPPEATMSQAAPGSRDDLKPGETVYVAARRNDSGQLIAQRVQVSKDGVKPTQ